MYANLATRPLFNPTSGENANSALQGLDKCAAPLQQVESRDLLKGQKAVAILHNGAIYRLQNTRQGKLILTK